MIALFLKDLTIAKKSVILIFLMALIFPIILFDKRLDGTLFTYATFNSFLLFYLQVFFNEIKSTMFIASLPVTRNKIILSRYFSGIIFTIISIIIGFICLNWSHLFNHGTLAYFNTDIKLRALISIAIILSYSSILNPIMFKFNSILGQNLGCAILVFVIMIMGMTISFIENYFLSSFYNSGNIKLGIFLCISLLLYGISLYISILLYRRKEL